LREEIAAPTIENLRKRRLSSGVGYKRVRLAAEGSSQRERSPTYPLAENGPPGKGYFKRGTAGLAWREKRSAEPSLGSEGKVYSPIREIKTTTEEEDICRRDFTSTEKRSPKGSYPFKKDADQAEGKYFFLLLGTFL